MIFSRPQFSEHIARIWAQIFLTFFLPYMSLIVILVRFNNNNKRYVLPYMLTSVSNNKQTILLQVSIF